MISQITRMTDPSLMGASSFVFFCFAGGDFGFSARPRRGAAEGHFLHLAQTGAVDAGAADEIGAEDAGEDNATGRRAHRTSPLHRVPSSGPHRPRGVRTTRVAREKRRARSVMRG